MIWKGIIQCIFRKLKKHLDSIIFSSSATAEFPALTICPDFDVAFKQDFLTLHKVMPNELRELNVPSSINMSFAEFYQLATHDLEV